MQDLTCDSSDDDDDIYLNSAARLKVLKNKNASTIPLEDSPKLPKQQKINKYSMQKLNDVVPEKTLSLDISKQIINVLSNIPVQSVSSESENCTAAFVDLSREDSIKSQELSFDDETISPQDCVRDVRLKIRWRSREIRVFELKENETFQQIFKEFADKEGVLKEQIYITKDNRRVFSTDTPVSINLSILDILEGGIVAKEVASKEPEPDVNSIEQNMCKIKVQTSAKEKIEVNLKNNETFEKVISACSEQLKVPPTRIKLLFDGDEIQKSDTPESMDIEEEACVDLRIVPA